MATMKTLNGYGFNATELNGKTSDNYLKKTDTASDSKKLGGKAPEYYIHPRNLLDNSDFTNPVNQRGLSSYTNGGYSIDRWRTVMASGTTTYVAGGILWLGKKYGQFLQTLPKHYEGKALTFAIYLSDVSSENIKALINDGRSQSVRSVHQGLNIVTYTVRSDATTLFVGLQNNSQSSDQSCTPVWAALYEGTYTADTLPPYVSKGYAAELAECQRYYQTIPALTHIPGVTNSSALFTASYKIPTMRIAPTVSLASGKKVNIYSGGYSVTTENYTMENAAKQNQITLNVTLDTGSFIAYKPGVLMFPVDIALIADL